MSRSTLRARSAGLRIAIAFTFVCASFEQLAIAQEATGRLSRADVEAATLAASRAHLLIPAGEAELPPAGQNLRSTTTRRQVVAETQEAVRDGTLIPAGEAADWQDSRQGAKAMSTRTRAEVVAETRAAAKAHELIPAGEGWYPVQQR